jgi:hypothetical protein
LSPLFLAKSFLLFLLSARDSLESFTLCILLPLDGVLESHSFDGKSI